MKAKLRAAAAAVAQVVGFSALAERIQAPKFRYQVECRGADGALKWIEDITNLITTVGGNDLIDKYFKGAAYTAAWYMGLAGTGTKAAGDALASTQVAMVTLSEAASAGDSLTDSVASPPAAGDFYPGSYVVVVVPPPT